MTSDGLKLESIPFADFAREIHHRQTEVSFNDLTVKPEGRPGSSAHPAQIKKIKLTPVDQYRLLKPYAGTRIAEQARSVIPLVLYLILFQVLILRYSVDGFLGIGGGVAAIILGLALFIEGLKQGLMPLGETVGHQLPVRAPMFVVFTVLFFLGIGVTYAEPAIGALQTAGTLVDPAQAPLLAFVLNQHASVLVIAVALSVGFAAVIGVLRFVMGWRLKRLLFLVVSPAIGLSLWATLDPHYRDLVGLAWDCGAVTTGPVTVPLVLALGIGVASAAGRKTDSLAGFGIVTLASIFPVYAVFGTALYLGPEWAASASQTAAAINAPDPTTFWLAGLRSILPLVLFLWFVQRFIIHRKIKNPAITFYGVVLAIIGMTLFQLGLQEGLTVLGAQSGKLIPGAYSAVPALAESPLYPSIFGFLIAFVFALTLGYGATLAEPALQALGSTVENLTSGTFRKRALIRAVSIGVGLGLLAGVAKIIWNIPLAWFIVPGYCLALALTAFSTEEYVNVAWDSAGVTTGPVTVPLVLALGLGIGQSSQVNDGFGLLALASLGPILSVLLTGLYLHGQSLRVIALRTSDS